MTAVAIGVGVAGAAISAGAAAAQGSANRGAAKKAAASQRAGIEQANAIQYRTAMESYNQRLLSVDEANKQVTGSIANARTELNRGYGQSANILDQTYGTPARSAIAESGVNPKQLEEWNYQRQQLADQISKLEQQKNEQKGIFGGLAWQKDNKATIIAAQERYNELIRQQDAIKPQLDQITRQIQTAEPYVAAQAASTGFNDTYNYAGGTDAGKKISTEEIKNWLSQNPNASTEETMLAMQQHGISTGQMAEATGLSENDINARINSVKQANEGLAPGTLKQAAKQTTDYLNTGYDAAGNLIDIGYDTAGKYINQGYDEAGNLIDIGYDEAGNLVTIGYDQAGNMINVATGEAIDTQQPFYDAGVRALQEQERMQKAGAEYLPTDPGYQFRLQQGLEARNNAAASRGNLLSGKTMAALDEYGQGMASQEFQNTFNRWNELSTKGQLAGNVISGLKQWQGGELSNLSTGKGTDLGNLSTSRATNLGSLATGRGADLGNLSTNRGQDLSGIATERGINLGHVSSNLGNNLSNLYTDYGNKRSGNALNQSRDLSNLTLEQGRYLANNALGNADYYGNTIGQAGKDQGANAIRTGNVNSSEALLQGRIDANTIGGVSNSLTQGLAQGLTLYGDQRKQQQQNDLLKALFSR